MQMHAAAADATSAAAVQHASVCALLQNCSVWQQSRYRCAVGQAAWLRLARIRHGLVCGGPLRQAARPLDDMPAVMAGGRGGVVTAAFIIM